MDEHMIDDLKQRLGLKPKPAPRIWAWVGAAALAGGGVYLARRVARRSMPSNAEANAHLDYQSRQVDLASDDSFPASDPPSHTPIKGVA